MDTVKDFTKTISFSVPGLETWDFQKRIPILTFIGGSQVGRRVLLADDTITLGRAHDATIMIDDPAVSRLHVEIGYDPPRYLFDLISRVFPKAFLLISLYLLHPLPSRLKNQ